MKTLSPPLLRHLAAYAVSLASLCSTAALVGCGSSDDAGSPNDGGGDAIVAPDSGGGSDDGGASDVPTSDAAPFDGDVPPGTLFGGKFRHGMNGGHVNPSFTDNDDGLLGSLVGADSNRIKLPEYFLETWGAEVRVDAAKSYQTNGMSNLVCFLIGPSAKHSTAPAGSAEYLLDQYIPNDLYQPIFAGDGTINPGNSWAAYVAETVTTYKPWVRIWEVWNEPDWTPDYETTKKWATSPPTKEDLVRFHGSIFDYVRMLRVTYAVVKKLDPTALVALGGIGYPTFLSSILRYSDDPAGGAIGSDYPNKGDAYFDVLNFHYYPLYTPGNSDAATAGMFALRDAMKSELVAAKVTGKSFNATETGAPRFAFGTASGGVDYAKNYLLKVMIRAHLEGFLGLDWFLLADGKPVGASTDSYDYMGLYLNTSGLTTTAAAVKTETGVAYGTLGKLLKGAVVDAAATASLALPSSIGGGAFHATDGRTIVALWAIAATGEAGDATYALSSSGAVTAYAWDYSTSGKTTSIAAVSGKASLHLTSTPQFFARP